MTSDTIIIIIMGYVEIQNYICATGKQALHNYIRNNFNSETVQQVRNVMFDVKFLTVSPES